MEASTTMTRSVIVVPTELSLHAAFGVMQRERIRHLPVVQSGALLGILSDRDVLVRSKLAADGTIEVPNEPVGSAMTPAPVTASPDSSIVTLVELMTERKIDAIPITSGSKLVGLVTSTDLLNLLREARHQRLPFDFVLEEMAVAYA